MDIYMDIYGSIGSEKGGVTFPVGPVVLYQGTAGSIGIHGLIQVL